MKRNGAILCCLAWLTASASAAVNVIVGGGVLRDANGDPLLPGSLVAIVASTQDNVFGVPTPSTILQPGASFGGDDVVLAVFPVSAPTTGVNGGAVGTVSFDYAAMGISNLGAGDQLQLYWFPAVGLNGSQLLPNAPYGTYRTDATGGRSNTTWLAPNDASGATLELNFLTQAAGGDAANSAAIAGFTVASTNGVTVAASSPVGAEPSTPGLFTFTRNGGTTNALTVSFSVTGTATSGLDYASLGTQVTFPAGASTTTKAVNVIDDALVEGSETVVLTLESGVGYAVGSPAAATVTIQDDDPGSTVNVAATDPTAGEPGTGQGTGTFTFTRSGSTASALTVNFSVSGTATSGSDYGSLGTTVSFASGVSTATKTVNVTDDALTEGNETVVVTLAGGSGYAVGNPASATLTIQDDEAGSAATPYVTAATLGTLRNDWPGWVGMQFTVGSTALTVSELGRIVAPGNTGTHLVKLVKASDGSDVPGAVIAVATSGRPAGQFSYAPLSSPVTLNAGTTYWLMSQENAQGDFWYDWDTAIATTGVAAADGLSWGFGPGSWYTYAIAGRSHVPLNFKYTVGGVTQPGATPYVTAATMGTLRNDWEGWVGMQFTVGSTALTVSELGRIVVPGNTGTHVVKLVKASDGSDVPGGGVAVATSGRPAGQFSYATLSSPVVLSAGTTYWLMSQENAQGDFWYDWDTVLTTTAVAAADGLSWGFGPGAWYTYAIAGRSHVPLNFKYTVGGVPQPSGTPYVTAATLGTLRNDWPGWVGMQFTVGSTALTVSELGRIVAPGNTGTHLVKLVKASDGSDVPGAVIAVATSGRPAGQFSYAPLSSPVTLNAGTTYWLMSQENAQGDFWYDWDTAIATTGVAAADGLSWGFGPGSWYTYAIAGRSHVPLNFKYTVGSGTAYAPGSRPWSLRARSESVALALVTTPRPRAPKIFLP